MSDNAFNLYLCGCQAQYLRKGPLTTSGRAVLAKQLKQHII